LQKLCRIVCTIKYELSMINLCTVQCYCVHLYRDGLGIVITLCVCVSICPQDNLQTRWWMLTKVITFWCWSNSGFGSRITFLFCFQTLQDRALQCLLASELGGTIDTARDASITFGWHAGFEHSLPSRSQFNLALCFLKTFSMNSDPTKHVFVFCLVHIELSMSRVLVPETQFSPFLSNLHTSECWCMWRYSSWSIWRHCPADVLAVFPWSWWTYFKWSAMVSVDTCWWCCWHLRPCYWKRHSNGEWLFSLTFIWI